MKNSIGSCQFAQRIAVDLDRDRILSDLRFFEKKSRYSGSSDGEDTVDFIEQRMRSLDIPVVRKEYDLYRSLPLSAHVEVVNDDMPSKTYPATPYVYSGNAKKLHAQLVFDELYDPENDSDVLMRKRCANVANKVILSYDASYQFARMAHKAGALGILNIWRANLAHHGTLGGVWGNPETEDLHCRYPYIPYVEVLKDHGEELRSLLDKGELFVSLTVAMDNRIVKSSMPVATIKGKSDKFVLVSGHYDSWYEGITDNAVANASMMEFARVLKTHQSELNRTVVLAWWSGHSDGRYAGSTWYCDNHWEDLYRRCVAHINMDICGCKGSDLVGFNTSMMEGSAFAEEFLKEFNKEPPIAPIPMARFADQSFWGVRVPFVIMPKFSRKVPDGEMPFFWWHTKHDLMDQVDPEVVLRDSRVIAKLASFFADTKKLPVHFGEFRDMMEKRLSAIETGLNHDFCLAPVFPAMKKLQKALEALEEGIKKRDECDDVIIRIAGELVRIVYTYSSPYHHDLAVSQETFPRLCEPVGKNEENTHPDSYLALRTSFVRQRNRLVGEITRIAEDCENFLLRWRLEE